MADALKCLFSFVLRPERPLSNPVCAARLLPSAIPSVAPGFMVSVHSASPPCVSLFFAPHLPVRVRRTCCIFPILPQGGSSCHSCYWQPSCNRVRAWKDSKESPETVLAPRVACPGARPTHGAPESWDRTSCSSPSESSFSDWWARTPSQTLCTGLCATDKSPRIESSILWR